MTTIHTTRDAAIQEEIIQPIEATGEASADEYHIEELAGELLEAINHGTPGYGWRLRTTLTEEDFWHMVELHAIDILTNEAVE